MKVNIEDTGKFPHILFEDVFEEDVLSLIDRELHFYKDKLLDVENMGASFDESLNYHKSASGVFLNELIPNPDLRNNFSDIEKSLLTFTNSEIYNQAIDIMKSKHHIFKYYTNAYSTLISYYENNDYYLPHQDISIYTGLFWYYKEPKSFTGGNLFFHENENSEPLTEIECKSNSFIIFPSCYTHSVSEIKMNQNSKDGRFALSLFMDTDNLLFLKERTEKLNGK